MLKTKLILFIYKLLTFLVAPLGAAFLAYSKRHDPPYGTRIFETLGFYKVKNQNAVWFHGASVGEIIALKPLIKAFMQANPHEKVILTTLTTTGANAASDLKNVEQIFAPLDSPFAVASFFRSYKPKLLVIIDTELWPNLLDYAKKNKVEVLIVNARMQEKNCLKYEKHLPLVKTLLSSKLTKVMCMSEDDQKRFIRIGVAKENTIVTGNIKFDLKPKLDLFTQTRELKASLNGFFFGAISLHDGEEVPVIEAYLKAKQNHPMLKLVLVPRHQSTTLLAIDYLEKKGIKYQQKSKLNTLSEFNEDILIGDSLGEIELYFALCDLVFMGGSFDKTGGHNPLEPAYFGLPVITGPVYHNFKEIFDDFINKGGACLVKDSNALASLLQKLIIDKRMLELTGAKAQELQRQGQGSLQKDLSIIQEYLG